MKYKDEGCVCDLIVVGRCARHNGYIGDRFVGFVVWLHVSRASRITIDHKVGAETSSISIAVSFVFGRDAWWRFDICW